MTSSMSDASEAAATDVRAVPEAVNATRIVATPTTRRFGSLAGAWSNTDSAAMTTPQPAIAAGITIIPVMCGHLLDSLWKYIPIENMAVPAVLSTDVATLAIVLTLGFGVFSASVACVGSEISLLRLCPEASSIRLCHPL